MPTPSIIVDSLVKNYGSIRAVDGISFSVAAGEIFGMLGPNGAGKTTTVEILEGLRTADSGRAEVLGMDISRDGAKVKEQVGVALQTVTMMPNLSPVELLNLFASFYPKSVPADSLLERFGLQEKRNSKVQTLSGGQAQRLSVALALVSDPQIIFLDEPTTGLDPTARRDLWDIIEQMRAAGKTVILTTHYMEEAERLCDRVAILDHGRILAMDTPQGLVRSQFSERAIEFVAPEGTGPETFEQMPSVIRAAAEDGEVVLYSDNVQKTLGALMDWADSRELDLGDVHVRRATLEDVFLKLTGRRIRE